MNRVERLLKLALLVRDKRDEQEPMRGYSSGAIINLHSVEIESATGITPAEQADALTALVRDYGCLLTFTAKKDYANRSELEPETLLHIAEVSLLRGESDESIERQILGFTTYTIRVDAIIDSVLARALAGTLCELTIVDGVTPVVKAGGETYRLMALKSGSVPQKIVEYASKGRYNLELNATDFEKISAAQLDRSDYNLVQFFKKNIFRKGGILQDFAVIKPKSFLLKRKSLLSHQALTEIKSRNQD